MRWLRQWVPAIGWAMVIWVFSTHFFSDAATSRFFLPALKWVFPHASPRGLLLMHALIRKMAHFVEYAVFSLLLLRAVRGERAGWRLPWALAALALAGSYAALDEVHQAFVPGRTASARDALLDTSGALAGQLFAWWLSRRHAVGEEASVREARP